MTCLEGDKDIVEQVTFYSFKKRHVVTILIRKEPDTYVVSVHKDNLPLVSSRVDELERARMLSCVWRALLPNVLSSDWS